MGIISSIKSGVSSIVSAVTGKSSTPSSSKVSQSKVSQPILIPGINYNPSTGVYTNPQGGKQSVAPPVNPFVPSGGGGGRGGSSGGGGGGSSGGSYNPVTGVVTTASGEKMSASPEGAAKILGGGTISQQLASKPSTQSSIGMVTAREQEARINPIEALKGFGGAVIYDVGVAFGRGGEYKDPFAGLIKPKYEAKIHYIGSEPVETNLGKGYIEQQGYNPLDLTFGQAKELELKQAGFAPLNFEQQQYNLAADISKGLQTKYQAAVDVGTYQISDTGELLGEGKALYEKEFTEMYSAKIEPAFKIEQKFGGLSEGYGFGADIKNALPTIGFIAASVVAPELAAGFIAGMGIRDVSKSMLSETMTVPERLTTGAIGVGEIGLGLTGFNQVVKAAEKSILSAELERHYADLSAQPFKFKELRIGEGTQLSFLKGERAAGNFMQELNIRGKIIPTGENQFIIPGARANILTKGAFDWNVYPAESIGTKIFAVQNLDVGSKGIALSLEKYGYGKASLSIANVKSFPVSEGSLIYKGSLGSEFVASNLKVAGTTKPYFKDVGIGISENIDSSFYRSIGGRLKEISLASNVYTAPSGEVLGIGTPELNLKTSFDMMGITKVKGIGDFNLPFEISGGASNIYTSGLSTQLKQSFLTGTSAGIKTGIPSLAAAPRLVSIAGISATASGLAGANQQFSRQEFKQTAIPRTNFRQMVSTIPITVTKTRTNERFGYGGLVIPNTMTKQFERQIAIPAFRTSQFERQITKQTQKGMFGFVSPTAFAPSFEMPPFKGGFGFLPKLPELGWGERIGKGFKMGRTYKYAPSIGAILRGVKSVKIGKAEKFAELTGYKLRPIISGRKAGKKSSKKRSSK